MVLLGDSLVLGGRVFAGAAIIDVAGLSTLRGEWRVVDCNLDAPGRSNGAPEPVL